MDRREERYRTAVRALRDAMDSLERQLDAGDLGQAPVALYRAGESWLVWAYYGTPYPEALAILPAPDGNEKELSRGITSAVFRKVPVSEIADDARSMVPLVEAEHSRVALRRFADAAASRRRDDLYYAEVADAYVSVTVRGDKNPIVTLALVGGINVDTMRVHVREARSRGLLTGSAGRAGGELTERAIGLLRQASDGE